MELTDFLKELLNINSISCTSFNENSGNGFSKLLCFLHRHFPETAQTAKIRDEEPSQIKALTEDHSPDVS